MKEERNRQRGLRETKRKKGRNGERGEGRVVRKGGARRKETKSTLKSFSQQCGTVQSTRGDGGGGQGGFFLNDRGLSDMSYVLMSDNVFPWRSLDVCTNVNNIWFLEMCVICV